MNDGGEAAEAASPARAQKILTQAAIGPRLGRYLLALVTGGTGSVVFVTAGMPLPWFLGALTACLVASVLHAPIMRPQPLAIPMRAVLGVAVGSAFTPAILERFGGMLGSLAILVPFMACIIIVSLVFYEKVAGFDRPTAFFSAVPGGLTDMTTMAEESGANQRAVILVQATRILVVVFTLPLWLQLHDGLQIGSVVASRVHLLDVRVIDLAIMIAIGWGGWWGARRLGLAGAPIVGPMLVSGLLHGAGITTVRVPMEVLTFAQISVGTLLGCQFRGLTMKEFSGTMFWGILNAGVLIAITTVVVIGVARLTGFPVVSVLLGFAPAGQTEMNLLAYILGLDVAYVALHHLMRLAIVILGAQIVLKVHAGLRRS